MNTDCGENVTRKTQNKEKSTLYTNVLRICEARDISIAELERKAGLGNGVVRKWNSASPTLRTAMAVSDCLGVSLDELAAPLKSS